MSLYPQTVSDFEKSFSTEKACITYLIKLRWPNGFICPRCENTAYWLSKRNLLICKECEHQVSVTAGTIFHRTRKPLRVWFKIIWWVVGQKNGASALGLQKLIGLKTYKTAWTWLHKIRRAMVRPGRDKLSGKVKVDESYIGGEEQGLKGRKIEKKALIVVAVEDLGKKIGRIRMKRIQKANSGCLHGFILNFVEKNSIVHTDGWEGYTGIEEKGYIHEITKQNEKKLLPKVHLTISLLKRWLLGTHQGAVSNKHLDYYLDEFVFRFNRRTSTYRGKLFYRLLQQAVEIGPTEYLDIVGREKDFVV